jgi:hypothetical protein
MERGEGASPKHKLGRQLKRKRTATDFFWAYILEGRFIKSPNMEQCTQKPTSKLISVGGNIGT